MSTKNFSNEVDAISKGINFESTDYQVNFDTSMGSIRLKLYPDVAPLHCKNIIALAKSGFYDNLTFHRVVKGFVIQGGCPSGTGTGGPGYHVKAEFNAKKHVPGTLSMARAQSPDSAGSQFFLCLEDVPFLDNQYTVFGQTIDDDSLNVVKTIGKVRTGPGDKPVETVSITKATVVETPR